MHAKIPFLIKKLENYWKLVASWIYLSGTFILTSLTDILILKLLEGYQLKDKIIFHNSINIVTYNANNHFKY